MIALIIRLRLGSLRRKKKELERTIAKRCKQWNQTPPFVPFARDLMMAGVERVLKPRLDEVDQQISCLEAQLKRREVSRNTNLRDFSLLLTILVVAMAAAQLTSPLYRGWVIVAEFAALAAFGWVLYWKLPLRNGNHA